MKVKVFLFIITTFVFSCKSDKKDVIKPEETNSENIETVKKPQYQDKLLDFREVNLQFNEDYKMKGFAMQKINDSVYAYVFELDNAVTPATVETYSIGTKAYSIDLKEPIKSSYSPNVETIDGKNYIIMRQKLTKITYIDSVEAYIYQRNNWKASGRLGTLKVKDILLNDKN